MKKYLLLLLFSVTSLLANAQTAPWGFGLPITNTLINGTLTCSVTDPTMGVKSFSESNVTLASASDGVVAWAKGGSYSFATYDVNKHSWQIAGGNSNTITTIQTSHGVSVWGTASGSYGYACYNPVRQQWAEGGGNTNGAISIATNYGVVAWTVTGGGYAYAVYDPSLAQWKSEGGNTTSPVITTRHGVVAWRTSQGYGSAIYNPTPHRWESFSDAGAVSEMVCDNGVVAWASATRYTVASYSPVLRHWTSLGYAATMVANTLQITDGTVGFTTNQGAQVYGYTAATDQWGSGRATALYCTLLPVAIPQSPFVYFHNLSIGASSYSIACGDGQVITRRVAWKQYASGNTYTPELTISNATSSTLCTGTVQVVLAGREGQASSQLLAVPNPATGTALILLPAGATQLKLLNLLGQAQWQALVPAAKTQYQFPLTGLVPGAYQLVAESPAGLTSTRLLVY